MTNMSILTLAFTSLGSLFKSQRQLRLENPVLRQQVAMLQKSVKRPRVSKVDKGFWILSSRYVGGWLNTLHKLIREMQGGCESISWQYPIYIALYLYFDSFDAC